MMQQQNQMFTGMQQYSQVISAQMPQAYGIGQYGTQGPVAPQFGQVPYAPRQQAGFSYGGQSPFGYGMGNQWGAAGVAAMGGAGQFALGGLGIAGGLGMLGKAGGIAFDPISAGMAGYGAARGLGMGMMGGLGVGGLAAGAVAAPMMFAQHALGSMVTGAQEQSGVNQSLGQYGFTNAMSRSGRGFSRQDAMAIGGVVREMQAIPEMMTSMSELTRIMDRMGQSGMMQGVRDAGEFSKRFKETIHTLKDVSKMMGSTMEEAMKAFQESKQSGFYSPDAIKQNIAQRQIVGGLTGMNQQQVANLQQYGAQGSFAAGGSRMGGARSITRIAGELGMANQMGLLSNDRLMELTGEEGSAGIQQLAGSLNDVGQRMGRSSLGTAMTLALGETKDGKYTGNMDQDLVQRVRSGQIGKEELLRLAHQKSQGRNAKLSFAAHRQRLTTEMVNSAGAQGVAMELSTILGERGFDNPDALNLVMQRYGVDERQANQVISLMKDMPGIQRGIAEAGTTEARRMSEQAFMRENASFEGLKTKIGKKFENVLTEPFKRLGANIANSVGESVDAFVDDIFGRYQTKITQMASDTVLSASMGNKGAIASLSAAGKDISRQNNAGRDLRNNSMVGGLLDLASGQQSAGDVQNSILTGLGKDRFYTSMSGDEDSIKSAGGRILKGGYFDKSFNVASKEGISNAANYLKSGRNRYEGAIKAGFSSGNATLAEAGATLEKTLLSSEELRNSDLTEQQKYEIIKQKMGYEGLSGADKTAAHTMGSGGVQSLLDKVRKVKGLEGAGDIEIIDALQKATGNQDLKTSMSMKGLAGGLDPNAGSLRDLSKRRATELDKAASGFGDMTAKAKSLIGEGGAGAKLLSAAFGGMEGVDSKTVERALQSKDGTKVDPKLLEQLGMTQKEFDAAKDQAAELATAGHGKASGADITKMLNTDKTVASAAFSQRQREIGAGLTERLSGADLGGLTKSGQGIAGHLQAMANGLTNDKGFESGATGDLLEELAHYRGKDKTKLMGLAGAELGAGAQMINDTNTAFRHSRKTKGGDRSVDALIEKLQLTGDTAADVRNLAKGGKSTDVDASEEKAIERYLGERTTKGMASSKGSEQSSINAASKNLGDVLKTMNENAANTAALLKGLMDAKAGGGK